MYAISETGVLKLFPHFVELKLFKLMVVDASKTCGLHTFRPAWGGGSPLRPPPLKTRMDSTLPK